MFLEINRPLECTNEHVDTAANRQHKQLLPSTKKSTVHNM